MPLPLRTGRGSVLKKSQQAAAVFLPSIPRSAILILSYHKSFFLYSAFTIFFTNLKASAACSACPGVE